MTNQQQAQNIAISMIAQVKAFYAFTNSTLPVEKHISFLRDDKGWSVNNVIHDTLHILTSRGISDKEERDLVYLEEILQDSSVFTFMVELHQEALTLKKKWCVINHPMVRAELNTILNGV